MSRTWEVKGPGSFNPLPPGPPNTKAAPVSQRGTHLKKISPLLCSISTGKEMNPGKTPGLTPLPGGLRAACVRSSRRQRTIARLRQNINRARISLWLGELSSRRDTARAQGQETLRRNVKLKKLMLGFRLGENKLVMKIKAVSHPSKATNFAPDAYPTEMAAPPASLPPSPRFKS